MRVSNRTHWGLLAATMAAVLVTAGLGVWQLDRAATKRALQAALERQQALPPLPLAELPRAPASVAALEQRRVDLRGRWSVAHTLYLDNRAMEGRSGFYVVTPLLLDGGAAVLVQRGFFPRDATDRMHIGAPPPPGRRGPGERSPGGRLVAPGGPGRRGAWAYPAES